MDMDEASSNQPVRYLRANRKLDINLTLNLVDNNEYHFRTLDETHLYCPENTILDWLWGAVEVELRKVMRKEGLNSPRDRDSHKDYKRYELNLFGLHCQWYIPLPD